MVHPGFARRLLLVTFLESFGTVLLERGIYFFTADRLRYSEPENLWLALAFGVAYVGGALASHRLTTRWKERSVLLGTLVALLLLHAALSRDTHSRSVRFLFPLIGLLQGLKWPVVESFISAGRSPAELVRLLGQFNVSWALSVPAALIAAGPIIASGRPELFFESAALINAIAIVLCLPLPARPAHFEDDHPARPAASDLARAARLLVSARWSMLSSYTLLFLLAPLMPESLRRLELEVTTATAWVALLDVARVVCFGVAGYYTAWRGRSALLVASAVTLPLAFALVLGAPNLPLLALGEVLFGLASGFCYSASLYYALLVRNAAVDAGGAHEGLIGAGFALGPLAGLAGSLLQRGTLGRTEATLLAVLPLAVGCLTLALKPLLGLAPPNSDGVPASDRRAGS
jgi:MFS family permease